jgi:hypothetical protein
MGCAIKEGPLSIKREKAIKKAILLLKRGLTRSKSVVLFCFVLFCFVLLMSSKKALFQTAFLKGAFLHCCL